MNLDSLRELQNAFAYLDGFIRAAIARAQAADHHPTDSLRGLIITEDEINSHLAAGFGAEQSQLPELLPAELDTHSDTPLANLINTFALSRMDTAILLLCLAPELDRRYERLYAYLQDDVSQRRPTVNLMMNLLGYDMETRFAVWERLAPHQPLRREHLIQAASEASTNTQAFLTQPLKVDHRIVAHLLGDDVADERLKGTTRIARFENRNSFIPDLADIVRGLEEAPLIYFQGRAGFGQQETAAAVCDSLGIRLVEADLARLAAVDIPFTLAWQLALREGKLAKAALLLTNWESCLTEGVPPADLWEALCNYGSLVFICGKTNWEPHDTGRSRRLLRFTLEIPTFAQRQQFWVQALDKHSTGLEAFDLDQLANKFRFTAAQINSTVNTAADLAASRGEGIGREYLYAGAQAHSSLRLGRLAKQIIPRRRWENLILPPDRLIQLQELCSRAEYTHLVQDEWGFGKKIAPRPGISALFAGDSGTGKTMSAEVIAHELGLAMYRIDLSAVVSKYIGETEKNLGAIFEEAQMSNAILFFDEADALFGKRSEVKDAHDRYANIEVAYLLQQIEDYDGIAILATNLRQNLDEAFTRRLDFVIDYPFPDAEYRKRIWLAHFPSEVPIARDVDLDEIAERYPLAGGNISNAAVASAYLAAADGRVITMQHVRHAIRREHQKMGRLVDDER